MITLTVHGTAQPAGSKRAFYNAKRGRPVVTEDNRRSAPWAALVIDAALQAAGEDGPLDGPLALQLTLWLPRPKGHFGSGRNAGTVKASAPAFPIVKPDATKLLRCIEDACTAILWDDDAQIVDQRVRKFYGAPPRAELVVWQLA
jgi:Holliday junction resolvase RusA-like endonuclease